MSASLSRRTLIAAGAGLLSAAVLAVGWVSVDSSAAGASVAQLGSPAPDFTLTDLKGQSHTLSSLRGKTVVLEWFNPGCPYVVHNHESGGSLSKLPATATASGVVWLAVNSGAPGKEGADRAQNEAAVTKWGMSYPVLVDSNGAVGHAYGAATTPHMYVIDPKGTLVYRGGIDNKPLGKGDGALVNHVEKALGDLGAGRPVATPDTKPYGCGVKYD